MYCKNCGNEISPDTKFCPVCGTRQDGEAPQQTPPQEPQAAPKKEKPFIRILAAVLMLAVAFVGFSVFQSQNEKKQLRESLTSYIEDNLEELEDLKEQIADGIDSALMAAGDTESALKRLKDTKKLSAKLVLQVLDINNSLKSDSELAEVSALYSVFAKKSGDALDFLIDVAENGGNGESSLREFIDLLEKADDQYKEFQQVLKALADEREVGYKKNSQLPFEDIIEALENIY